MGLAWEDGMGDSKARQSMRQLTGAGEWGRFVRALEYWGTPCRAPPGG